MIMGIGNLTELTDVDSAGVNTILIGFCQELAIRSVLTTAVINWARSSVREIDLARRLVHHAVSNRSLPKHVEPRLVALRDPRVAEFGADNLAELQRRIRDPNWRIFAEGGMIIAMNNEQLRERPRSVRALRADGGHRRGARVLPRIRDDEGENRLDAEQDLSPGSSAGVGLLDRAGAESSRAAKRASPAASRRQPTRLRRPRNSTNQARGRRDTRRDRDNAERRRHAQHRADGPAGRRRREPGAVRASPVTDRRRPTTT